MPHEDAIYIRDDAAFFQAVQSVLAKRAPADAHPKEELDHAVRQIVARAVASDPPSSMRFSLSFAGTRIPGRVNSGSPHDLYR